MKVAEVALKLGAGRMTKEDNIDYGVGVELVKNIGDYVNTGDVIANLYVGSKSIEINEMVSAFKIDDKKKEKEPIIYGIIR